MIPYNFTDVGRGYINIVKNDGNPETKFVLYTDRDNGYGMYTTDYGVDDDEWQLHRLAQPATMEYLNGADGRYYRIRFADIRRALDIGGEPNEPDPLEVRHTCWFGESPNEIRRRITAQRRKRLEQAIAQARQRKADQEERERREAEEAAKLARVEAEIAAEEIESFEDQLARMLAEEGLTEFAE